MTDLTIGQVQKHPMIKTGGEGSRAILEGHARGQDAIQLDKMSNDNRLKFALEQMNKVHPNVFDYYEGGTSKSWQLDPYSRGAYSLFLPGQITSWLPEIIRPEGRIHFAGNILPYTPPAWRVRLNQVLVLQMRSTKFKRYLIQHQSSSSYGLFR
jgi:monoamine oxidase